MRAMISKVLGRFRRSGSGDVSTAELYQLRDLYRDLGLPRCLEHAETVLAGRS